MGVRYAEVIGDPIAHSKSPLIHEFWLQKLGQSGVYRRSHVGAEVLPSFLQQRRHDLDWRGCNVTIPHKTAALSLVDDATEDARGAGAANTLFRAGGRLVGANTDVIALRHDMHGWAEEASLLDLPIIVFGAGGAARAVLQAIRDVEGVQVELVNRDAAKAERLLREFGLSGRAVPLGTRLSGGFAIVNASSLGMNGFPALPITKDDVTGPVCELVYAPLETDLLKLARQAGQPALDGLSILIGQAKAAFEIFFGIAPPLGTEPELRELLTR
jgi:shikimate dehydrogenase